MNNASPGCYFSIGSHGRLEQLLAAFRFLHIMEIQLFTCTGVNTLLTFRPGKIP